MANIERETHQTSLAKHCISTWRRVDGRRRRSLVVSTTLLLCVSIIFGPLIKRRFYTEKTTTNNQGKRATWRQHDIECCRRSARDGMYTPAQQGLIYLTTKLPLSFPFSCHFVSSSFYFIYLVFLFFSLAFARLAWLRNVESPWGISGLLYTQKNKQPW